MDNVAVDVVISGRVQGVFFRARTSEQAERLGVTGWVRNEPDGTVAAHFEGTRDAVEEIVAWCESGPPRAQVGSVVRTPGRLTGAQEFAAY